MEASKLTHIFRIKRYLDVTTTVTDEEGAAFLTPI